MKKIIFSLVMVITVFIMTGLSLKAQIIDVTAEKNFSSIGKTYEGQSDNYGFQVRPFSVGEGGYFGFYLDHKYNQFAHCFITNGRETAWSGGLSFVNLNNNNNLFFKMNLGLKQATIRYEKLNCDYNDYQKDFLFDGLMTLAYYRPEVDFFNRTIITASMNQPITSQKKLYYDSKIVDLPDSVSANLQYFSLNLDQTLLRFYLSEDWIANLDVNIGYSFEHPIITSTKEIENSSFIFGGSISIFGGEHFYQNMIKVYAYQQVGGFMPGFNAGVGINLTPIIVLLLPRGC